MRSISKSIPLTVALSALSIAAVGTGCKSSSHPNYYTTTTTTDYGTAGYAQSSPSRSSNAGATGSISDNQAATDSGNTVVPLYEESIKVGTREVDAGSVKLRKVVTTETVNQPVQIRTERLVIERESAGSQASQTPSNAQAGTQNPSGQAFQEQETVIRLKKEEPVVETQIVPSGRVVAQKRTETQQQNIQRQVRHENVQVEKIGNADNITVSDNLRQSPRSGEASGSGPSLENQSRGSGTNTTNNANSTDSIK